MPERKNPEWNNQVKINAGALHDGARHRAIDVASRLFKAGRWNGTGIIRIRDAYEVHNKMAGVGGSLDLLVEGKGQDYWFESDSHYKHLR